MQYIINEERIDRLAARLVREALEAENYEYENFQGENAEYEDRKKRRKKKSRKSKRKVGKNKRNVVIKWLQDPSVNCAEIMRELWHPEDKAEEDAARSYFYKCRDGKLNDDGNPYRFTDEDINTLYSLKSGNI